MAESKRTLMGLIRLTVKFSVLLFIATSARAQVSVTGNLKDLGVNNATAPTTYVQFTLQNYSSAIPMVLGTNVFVSPTPPVLRPSNVGVISGTIEPNDLISPANTYYRVCIYFQGQSQWCQNYRILSTGGTFNLNTAQPIVTPPPGTPPFQLVLLNPNGGQNILQPGGSFFSVNGNNVSLISGTVTIGDCVQFGAPPFLLDAGAPCGSGGGGGGSPGGLDTQIQFNKGGAFGATAGFGLDSSTAPTTFNDPFNATFGGLNPYIDITSFGGRAVTTIPQTTVSSMSGTIVTLASAAAFRNGDGVTISGAGAANTLSTPSAPTVTPSSASGAIGAHRTVASPSGSTNYQYQIVARDKNGGFTAAGTAGTTSTGQATLGAVSQAISTLTRSNNTVTVVTSSGLATTVGSIVFITGTSDASFNGFFVVSSVTSSTQFAYTQGMDTRAGATTSATGGTAQIYQENRLLIPLVTGAWQYCVYGRTSGSMALIGTTVPGQEITVSSTQYATFDDFGSTFTGTPSVALCPATPPVSATNDYLATTVVSGGGTTSLTVANSAISTPPSGANITFDDSPALAAAAADSISLAGGVVHIPAAPANAFYPIESHTILSCYKIMQGANVQVFETIELGNGCQWSGEFGGSGMSGGEFSWVNAPRIDGQGAYPILDVTSSQIKNINFTDSDNGVVVLLNGTVQFNDSFIDDSFNMGRGTDYTGLAVLGLGVANQHFESTYFQGKTPNTLGSTIAPVVLYMDNIPTNSLSGNIFCDECYFNLRGMAIDDSIPIGTSVRVHFKNAYGQALVSPLLEADTMSGLVFKVDGFTNDTSSTAVLANWGSQIVGADMSDIPYGKVFTGNPIYGATVEGTQAANYQNRDQFISSWIQGVRNPIFNPFTGSSQSLAPSSSFQMQGPLHFPTGEWLFDSIPVAPVASAPTSGTSFLGTNTWYFVMTATDLVSGESVASPTSNSCVTTSTNQICPLTGTAMAGSVAYSFYATLNSAGLSASSLSGCRNLTAPSCNAGASGALDGGTIAPTGGSFALTGALSNKIWSPNLILVGALPGSQSFSDTFSGTFTANRTVTAPDASGIMTLFSGTLTNSDCPQISVVGGVPTLIDSGSACGGGGGSLTSTQIGVGSPTNTLTGYADFTWTESTKTMTLGGTDNGVEQLGSSSSTHASFIPVYGGSGASNTNPGYIIGYESPAGATPSTLFPCNGGGRWCIGTTAPSADSANTVQTHNRVNAINATTYTILDGDGDGLTTFSNAASIAITLPCPSGTSFTNGWREMVKQTGAGTPTITVSGCTIQGTGAAGTTIAVTTSGFWIVSDGTNYQVVQ